MFQLYTHVPQSKFVHYNDNSSNIINTKTFSILKNIFMLSEKKKKKILEKI